jgi:hypothetical protein
MVLTIILWTRRRVLPYNTIQQFATMDNEKSKVQQIELYVVCTIRWGKRIDNRVL